MKPEMWRQKMVRALPVGEDRRDQELAEKLSACRNREGQRWNLPMGQAVLPSFGMLFLTNFGNMLGGCHQGPFGRRQCLGRVILLASSTKWICVLPNGIAQ
jgi:hypothetical protein